MMAELMTTVVDGDWSLNERLDSSRRASFTCRQESTHSLTHPSLEPIHQKRRNMLDGLSIISQNFALSVLDRLGSVAAISNMLNKAP